MFYDLWQMPVASGYGSGGDDGAILTAAAAQIEAAGGGTLRIHGSPVVDTPIQVYQGVNLEFSGAMASTLNIRNAICGIEVHGIGVGDLGIGGHISGVEITGNANATGIKRHGTRRHVLREVVFSDLAIGDLIVSRDDGDPTQNKPTYGGAFNYTEKSIARRCGTGVYIKKGEAYDNRNRIEMQLQSCGIGALVSGSGTNYLTLDCQNCDVNVDIVSEDGKESHQTEIHFRNENGDNEIQCRIEHGTKKTRIYGVYNDSKIEDNGRQTMFPDR